MSRQSDSNRRPADYKSAALNQLSYAGAASYESRFGEFIKSSSDDRAASPLSVTLLKSSWQFGNSPPARARQELRYGVWRSLCSSSLRCVCSLAQSASNDWIRSLPRGDSDWFVRVGLDKARISSRISASRSGGSGGTLINVIDAADLRLCLLLHFFC